MAYQLRMPSLGQTTDELRIVAWLKDEGDSVALGEPIVEVETDKAILQVESSFSGVLLKRFQQIDAVVLAGAPIALIGQPGETQADTASASIAIASPTQAPSTAANAANVNNEQILATPVARKLAKDWGIDLRVVRGSGPGGRIEKRDVEALSNAASNTASNSASNAPSNTNNDADAASKPTEIAVPRNRQVIAQRLTRSIQTIPQITLNATVNMRAALALIASQRAKGQTRVKVTHLLLQAVARALRAQPHMNRLWRDAGPVYQQLAQPNVGVAVANEDNLIVATLVEPDRFDLGELATMAEAVFTRARLGTLQQTDTARRAITISNLGMHGIESFEAIVDPDQTMILAVGRIADQVIVKDGGIYIAPMMTLSLSVDHRVADGVAAAQFLNIIREDLERSAP